MKCVYHYKRNGFAQIFVLAGMLLVSAALPVATKLVQQNQENRSNAASNCSAYNNKPSACNFAGCYYETLTKSCSPKTTKKTTTTTKKTTNNTTKSTKTCTYNCTSWTDCKDGKQTCKAQTKPQSGCTGGTTKIGTTQKCTPAKTTTNTSKTTTTKSSASTKTCTSFTYTDWNPASCPSSGRQTRTVKTSSPSGCTGGTRLISRNCSPPTPTRSATKTTCSYICTKWDTCSSGWQTCTTDSKLSTSQPNCTGGRKIGTRQKCTPVTSSSNTTTKKSDGSTCSYNSECTSGYCNLTIKKCATKITTPTCSSSKCSGCTTPSTCSSAGCYWEVLVKTCTTKVSTEKTVSTTKDCVCSTTTAGKCDLGNSAWKDQNGTSGSYTWTCTGSNCNPKNCSIKKTTVITGCSSSACGKCNSTNCGKGNDCLWGYNGSSTMYCYPKTAAIPVTDKCVVDGKTWNNNAAICSNNIAYICKSGVTRKVEDCGSRGCDIDGTCKEIGCSSSACGKCNSTNCGKGNDCLWGYNNSSTMYCYSKLDAVPIQKKCSIEGGICFDNFATCKIDGGIVIGETDCPLSTVCCRIEDKNISACDGKPIGTKICQSPYIFSVCTASGWDVDSCDDYSGEYCFDNRCQTIGTPQKEGDKCILQGDIAYSCPEQLNCVDGKCVSAQEAENIRKNKVPCVATPYNLNYVYDCFSEGLSCNQSTGSCEKPKAAEKSKNSGDFCNTDAECVSGNCMPLTGFINSPKTCNELSQKEYIDAGNTSAAIIGGAILSPIAIGSAAIYGPAILAEITVVKAAVAAGGGAYALMDFFARHPTFSKMAQTIGNVTDAFEIIAGAIACAQDPNSPLCQNLREDMATPGMGGLADSATDIIDGVSGALKTAESAASVVSKLDNLYDVATSELSLPGGSIYSINPTYTRKLGVYQVQVFNNAVAGSDTVRLYRGVGDVDNPVYRVSSMMRLENINPKSYERTLFVSSDLGGVVSDLASNPTAKNYQSVWEAVSQRAPNLRGTMSYDDPFSEMPSPNYYSDATASFEEALITNHKRSSRSSNGVSPWVASTSDPLVALNNYSLYGTAAGKKAGVLVLDVPRERLTYSPILDGRHQEVLINGYIKDDEITGIIYTSPTLRTEGESSINDAEDFYQNLAEKQMLGNLIQQLVN